MSGADGVEHADRARAVSIFPQRWLDRSFPPMRGTDAEKRAWCKANIVEDEALGIGRRKRARDPQVESALRKLDLAAKRRDW